MNKIEGLMDLVVKTGLFVVVVALMPMIFVLGCLGFAFHLLVLSVSLWEKFA